MSDCRAFQENGNSQFCKNCGRLRIAHVAHEDRPRIGDTVRTLPCRGPLMEGVVVDTFYGNGEGGMHVQYARTCSWTCYRDVEIIELASDRSEQ